jgi:hypothetical protein
MSESASDRNMLDLAYPSVRQDDGYTCSVGPLSDRTDAGYVWQYWIPWMAMADRQQLQLRPLDRVLAEGRPFVFPLEFRWEFIDWFARGMDAALFGTPHIPPSVLNASRAGKAVILMFFGHEGRRLEYVCSGQKRSAYDLILDFMRRHGLPQGSVWFVNGNLTGRSEYNAWKCQRFGSANVPDLFETRFVEPFSYLFQAMQRMREAGFDLTLEHKSKNSSQGFYLHEMTRLVLEPSARETNVSNVEPIRKANKLPPKLFLCMNRQPHKHRRAIVCYLLYRGFLQHSLVSFRDDSPAPDCCDGVEMKAAWKELQKLLPLTIDNDLPLEFEAYFRDNAAVVKIGELWPYRDTCFSIVTETLFCNDRMFVSEKLWKPIMIGHPFVVMGTPGTLAYLHSQGFKTFAPTIDENYDTQVNDEDRIHALIKTIDALGSLDDSKRLALLEKLQPIVTHNMRLFRQLRLPMARVWDDIGAQLAA